jgi:succinyl-CoA synthetase alpha subunit
VTVADERAIKDYGLERNLLVMGPDCGTAIVNGIPLGFANVVRRGHIGLVAASGTGLQEVTCRIHNEGGGVSQAIGTGGRDLKDAIGGITMLQALGALATDPATRVIVLISKPPAADIAQKILALAAEAEKPVVVHFLGAPPESVRGRGLTAATSLQHAGDVAVALATGSAVPASSGAPTAIQLTTVAQMAAGMAASQYAVRGLFTGGTFCYEAQLAFRAHGFACRSNAPAAGVAPLEPHDGHAEGHVFIDMGDDDYTRGRPHPMIDPALRNAGGAVTRRRSGHRRDSRRCRPRLRLASGSGATSCRGAVRSPARGARPRSSAGGRRARLRHRRRSARPRRTGAKARSRRCDRRGKQRPAALICAALARKLAARPGAVRFSAR